MTNYYKHVYVLNLTLLNAKRRETPSFKKFYAFLPFLIFLPNLLSNTQDDGARSIDE